MIQVIQGNIWNHLSENAWFGVTTNIGWSRANGDAVMGRGIALQAAKIWPQLRSIYGQYLRSEYDRGVRTFGVKLFGKEHFHDGRRFLMFPTKELNPAAPHLSWQRASTLEQIGNSAESLKYLLSRVTLDAYEQLVYLPAPGCGNGCRQISEVLPVLQEHLEDVPHLIKVVEYAETGNEAGVCSLAETDRPGDRGRRYAC